MLSFLTLHLHGRQLWRAQGRSAGDASARSFINGSNSTFSVQLVLSRERHILQVTPSRCMRVALSLQYGLTLICLYFVIPAQAWGVSLPPTGRISNRRARVHGLSAARARFFCCVCDFGFSHSCSTNSRH